MEKHNIVSIAFATALASMAGVADAGNPLTSHKIIFPNLESNSYHQYLPHGIQYESEKITLRRAVDCTLGTIHNEMVIESAIAQSGHKFIQPTAPISVTSLSPKAQETIRRNCSSNGLQAFF